jgi:hypothetical protein
MATPDSILRQIASNNPNIQAQYDPDYFNMVSGNEVGTTAKSQLLSKEDFVDPPTTDCSCAPTSSSLETSADRLAFESGSGHCIVDDFPLQKWVHVVVSQYNQVLDVYVDGQLRSSCVMPGFPAIVQDALVLCPDGGFGGMIAKVDYTNSVLTATDVAKLYVQGPESRGDSVFASVPRWVWVLLVVIVFGAIAYSLVA